MGAVSIDTEKKFRSYEDKYKENSIKGVTAVLKDIHKLKNERLAGSIDAAIILLDFDAAVRCASLSSREKDVIHCRFIQCFTQKETAEALNISRKSVRCYENRAVDKIAGMTPKGDILP
jgi:RNA polymerase sigma factor (sigma-70 family)